MHIPIMVFLNWSLGNAKISTLFQIFSIPIGIQHYLIIVLVCISLKTCNVGHLFICFSASVPSFVKSLFRYQAQFLIGLLFFILFILFIFKNSLYILESSLLSNVSFCKYFLLVSSPPSYSLNIVFHKTGVFRYFSS